MLGTSVNAHLNGCPLVVDVEGIYHFQLGRYLLTEISLFCLHEEGRVDPFKLVLVVS